MYLLDDPLAAIDPELSHKIFHGVRRFLKEKTVVMATHKQEFVEKCDSVILLKNGEAVLQKNENCMVEEEENSSSEKNIDELLIE